jgi:hypothetical protein
LFLGQKCRRSGINVMESDKTRKKPHTAYK